MPRNNSVDAARTREQVLRVAADSASADGFSHVSTRSVARRVGLSSSGAVGPFDSREALLLEALDLALASFVEQVVAPSSGHAAGLATLEIVVDRWVAYLTRCPFSGGCVMTAASVDLDGRPGELRDKVHASVARWRAFLSNQFRAAGRSDIDAEDDAVTLMGIAMAINQEVQLLGEGAAAVERGRRTMLAVINRSLPPGVTSDERLT